jgi:hypothetical protein
MLTGTASTDEFLEHAATMTTFDSGACAFRDVLVFQAMFEIGIDARQVSLPAGLHPTNPPTAVFQAWHCPESPWGPFTLAQARVGCRSGLRPRGMTQGCVVDNEHAAAALRSRWGLPARVGTVRLDANYHDVTLDVAVDGGDVFSLQAFDPIPLGEDDVSYATTVSLAHTPRGLRLAQIDTDLAVRRAERVTLRTPPLDTHAFGLHPSVRLAYPVAASLCRGELDLHPLRYVCLPDVLAFTGTESVT